MKLRLYFLISSLFIFVLVIQGQVTIGSDNEPNTGALLHLMEEKVSDGNPNATKGLLLPRVNLTHLEELFPMFEKADGTPTDEYIAKKDELKKIHKGLVVYNLNECLHPLGYSLGVHEWDGKQWNNLMPVSRNTNKVGTVTDIEGNVYTTMNYGPEAGVWMTQNLRTTTLPDGTKISMGYNLNKIDDYSYYFPTKPSSGNNFSGNKDIDSKTFKKYPEYGLLYNAAAANYGSSIFGNDKPDSGNTDHEKVQGICPDGWHLPSDREWSLLEKELLTSGANYSDYTPATAWNDNFFNAVATTNRGDHNKVMLMPCYASGTDFLTGQKAEGYSYRVEEGGFAAILTGYAQGANIGTTYGFMALYWTSSPGGGNTGGKTLQYSRQLMKAPSVFRYKATAASSSFNDDMGSVRCKKD